MLTLSMIVKNEETYLDDCLKSVSGAVDEIVIVDTGSTDKTLEIAEKHHAQVFHFIWQNDFAAARNYALEKAHGDWILYLDADERLSPDSIRELKRLTAEKINRAYSCRIINIDSISNRPSVMTYVRLFPNDENIKFDGAIHEQIEYSLRRNNYEIVQSEVKINHLGYDITKPDLQLKAGRNLNILLREYERKKNGYYAYQIAQTYGVMEDKKNAVRYFNEAIKDDSLFNEYKSIAYRFMAIIEAENNNLREAYSLINKSLEFDKEQPLALIAASRINFKLNNFTAAAQHCLKAWEVNKKFLRGNKKSFQAMLLDEKTIIYEGLNIGIQSRNNEYFNSFYNELKNLTASDENLEEFEMFNALLNNEMMNSDEINRYIAYINNSNIEVITSLLDRYQYNDVKTDFYRNIYEKMNKNSLLLNKYGLFLSERKEYFEAEKIFKESWQINKEDPSTVFYLISVYIQNDKYEKILPVITTAENKFMEYPEIISHLNRLKNKLNIH